MDKQKFIRTIKENREKCKSVEELVKTATYAAKISTKKLTRKRNILYWWNGEIENKENKL